MASDERTVYLQGPPTVASITDALSALGLHVITDKEKAELAQLRERVAKADAALAPHGGQEHFRSSAHVAIDRALEVLRGK